MKKNKQRLNVIVAVFVAAILLVLSGCAQGDKNAGNSDAGSSQTKKETKIATIGLTGQPSTFNPVFDDTGTSVLITEQLYPPFVQVNDNLEFVPRLAESITTEDYENFIVKIHPKAKWSDGKPVTADDVIFTAQLIANPEVGSNISGLSLLKGFEKTGRISAGASVEDAVQKVDDNTVRFVTAEKTPLNLFQSRLAVTFKTAPKHVLEGVAPADILKNSFALNPKVTYGPFHFVTYQANQFVELKANEDYFLGKPKLDKLIVKIVQSANLLPQLQIGEVSINNPSLGQIAANDIPLVEQMDTVNSFYSSSRLYQYLGINNESISDKRVRQAIAYAIDRQSLLDNLLKGEGELHDAPFTSVQGKYFDATQETRAHNVEKAKELLAEAGWDTNQTLRFIVPAGIALREQTADIVVQNLKEAGINVSIEKLDLPSVGQRARALDYDLLILTAQVGADPDITQAWGPNNNWQGYNNPEMNTLLEEGSSETDEAKRQVVYSKVQAQFAEDVPAIPLYFFKGFVAYNKSLDFGEQKNFMVDTHLWDVSK